MNFSIKELLLEIKYILKTIVNTHTKILRAIIIFFLMILVIVVWINLWILYKDIMLKSWSYMYDIFGINYCIPFILYILLPLIIFFILSYIFSYLVERYFTKKIKNNKLIMVSSDLDINFLNKNVSWVYKLKLIEKIKIILNKLDIIYIFKDDVFHDKIYNQSNTIFFTDDNDFVVKNTIDKLTNKYYYINLWVKENWLLSINIIYLKRIFDHDIFKKFWYLIRTINSVILLDIDYLKNELENKKDIFSYYYDYFILLFTYLLFIDLLLSDNNKKINIEKIINLLFLRNYTFNYDISNFHLVALYIAISNSYFVRKYLQSWYDNIRKLTDSKIRIYFIKNLTLLNKYITKNVVVIKKVSKSLWIIIWHAFFMLIVAFIIFDFIGKINKETKEDILYLLKKLFNNLIEYEIHWGHRIRKLGEFEYDNNYSYLKNVGWEDIFKSNLYNKVINTFSKKINSLDKDIKIKLFY